MLVLKTENVDQMLKLRWYILILTCFWCHNMLSFAAILIMLQYIIMWDDQNRLPAHFANTDWILKHRFKTTYLILLK